MKATEKFLERQKDPSITVRGSAGFARTNDFKAHARLSFWEEQGTLGYSTGRVFQVVMSPEEMEKLANDMLEAAKVSRKYIEQDAKVRM